MYNTKKEGVVCIYDENNVLIALIIRDDKTGYNLTYQCTKMSIDEMTELISVQNKSNAKITNES